MQNPAEGCFVGGCKVRPGELIHFKYVVPMDGCFSVWDVKGTFLHMFRTIGGKEYIIIDVDSINDHKNIYSKKTFFVGDIPINSFVLQKEMDYE